jgi:peroxiredoxin
MRANLGAGGPFPDLKLPDHAGNLRRLSELAAGDPLFLNFYRGLWSPKEQAFFRGWCDSRTRRRWPTPGFVSVSVDPPEVAAAFRAGLDARWTFLSDTERRYQAELDLRETTDTVHRPYCPPPSCCCPTSRPPGLERLLVLGPADQRGAPAGFRAVIREIRSDWEVPAR